VLSTPSRFKSFNCCTESNDKLLNVHFSWFAGCPTLPLELVEDDNAELSKTSLPPIHFLTLWRERDLARKFWIFYLIQFFW
jgi:hypothetical protein